MHRIIFLLAMVVMGLVDANPIAKKRFLLITGCGRSGTTFMQEYLQRSGISVTHERTMGDHGCVSWLLAADCDWAPWGPLYKKYTFEHIFHQVRGPLKVIQSVYNFPPGATWKWISSVVPEIQMTDSALTKSAKYWYYWNMMAESKAEWTYRVEDFGNAYKEMSKRLGVPLSGDVLKNMPRNINTRGQAEKVVTWKLLREELDPDLYDKIRELAVHYGYNPQ